MEYPSVKLIALTCPFLLMLIGCDATTSRKPRAESAEPIGQVEPVREELPPLNTREHIDKALELFETGQQEKAIGQLRQAREQNPRSRTVKKLLKQLETDPQEYFGKEYFEYRVRKGDTLSELAKRFLGDELEFIALTRYNGLAKPSLLVANQTLRIPGSDAATDDDPKTDDEVPAEVPADETPSEPVSDVPSDQMAYETAYGMFEQGDYAGTIAQIESADPDSAPPEGRLKQLLLNAYGAEAGILSAGERWEEARDMLKKASALGPEDQSVAEQLLLVETGMTARDLFIKGQKMRRYGNLAGAQARFSRAADLVPDNPDYAYAEKQVRTELVESYHRQALSHYRREQLDEAQAYWEKVLRIDPDNKIAPGYLSKVEEIRLRLQALDGK